MKRTAAKVTVARLKKLREDVAKYPDSAGAHLRLGTALCQVGLYEEAERECRRTIELDPEDPRAWVNLGGVLMSMWDFPGCVEANHKAMECREDLMEAHYNCGLGHMYLGQAEQMVACFSRVLELDPHNAGAHYHLAVGLLALQRVERARVSLNRACQLGYHPEPDFLRELEKEERARHGGNLAIVEIEPNQKSDSTEHS